MLGAGLTIIPGPASATSGGFLTAGAQTIAGAKTWQVPHTDGAAETLAKWVLDEDTNGFGIIENNSSSNGVFRFQLRGVASNNSQGPALALIAQSTGDTGTSALMSFNSRNGAATPVTTRPYFEWQNAGVSMMQLIPTNGGAATCLVLTQTSGIGVPSTASRSAGTKLVLWNSFVASSVVDYGFGIETGFMWASVANSSAGFKWYAGITNIMKLDGNGQRTYTAGAIRKSRIALTTPVTIAATDDIVFVKLTAPGPVAVNWPASPVAGQEHCVVDATGDANTNNITHTPAAGNFNGGATKVQNVAYSRLTGAYTGAEWIGA